jgi:xanthine dehydrogenase accessory factor
MQQSQFYEKILDLLRAGKRGALVTVIETEGSTPRKMGAKMLVTEDLELVGTVGGGCVEAEIIAAARTCMKTRQLMIKDFDLTRINGDENDMLCGGRLRVMIEPIAGDDHLLICGGGHVGLALYQICRLLDFRITVTDDRPQFASKQRFPEADQVIAAPYEKQFQSLSITPNTFIAIVTRAHAGDEICLKHALQSPASYIGLLGSRTKFAMLKKRLVDSGVSRTQLKRIHCPIGLDIGAVTPEEIAVSIAAEMIKHRVALRTSQDKKK